MKKLIIEKIDKFIYTLNDGNKVYNVNLEFFGAIPEEDNLLYVNESLVNNFNEPLAFGFLNDICGRDITDVNDPDILVLKQNDKLIYMKRLYG